MLKIERVEGGAVVVWTIDEPATRNALSYEVIDGLARAVGEASNDPGLRAAILTAAGDVFVSGGDLRELRGRNERSDAERLTDAGFALTASIAELPFPVIAALPGAAIGGGAELALACDMRVADARTRLALKQVRMGVTTSWGTVPRLVALVGASTAARLLYTGCEIDSAEALRLGLVDERTEDGHAVEAALRSTREIALASPTAIAAMKRLVRASLESARDVRSLERALFVDTWSGPDHRDASEAWFERRPPKWSPR